MSGGRLREFWARWRPASPNVTPCEGPASLEPSAVEGPAGRRLGRFTLDRELGQGATSTVWLACDEFGSPAAIKAFVLGSGVDEDADVADARDRFGREAAAAQRLNHPGIVGVLDAGESQGIAWIAMEYVPGRDLLPHARAGELLPLAQLLPQLAGVAEALDHAHRQGVVHRDIKPANLMLDSRGARVKISDFGVARIADAVRTRTGLMLGTPSYMAPEQLTGAPVDARSDVYALGVTAFQLLTGRLPYEAASIGALMASIAHDPVPDVRQWRPELPAELAGIVALAMEKQPALRYATAGEMATDLRTVASALLETQPPPQQMPDHP